MAEEPWNRVNIAFPGAVSSVRIHLISTTDALIRDLLAENQIALLLIRSELLQTEVRVLYELLYILNNSFRSIKTFKALKQVEQCIHRLKSMKLNVALEELVALCPKRVQRTYSIQTGEECDVPSQPMLEWLCLKVLGAAQLMSCTLDRCRRAFILSKQQMKLEEFIVVNIVICSMLSRLWVIVRGILVHLSSMYQPLLDLCRVVAEAHPMPFLTDFSLPADMAQFLGPSETSLLTRKTAHAPHAKDSKKKQRKKKKSSVPIKNQGKTRKVKEDMGVAIERGIGLDTDMKPFLKVFKDFIKGKSSPQKTLKTDKKQNFKKQVSRAASFSAMLTHLEERIQCCKSKKMEKERRLLSFLHLKCRRMKCLEAEGYNVQRKLETFRKEVRWASSPRGSETRTRWSSAATRRQARHRTRFQALRTRFRSSTVRTAVKRTQLKRKRKRTELSVCGLSGYNQRKRTAYKAASKTAGCDDHDDIDDIFASVGL